MRCISIDELKQQYPDLGESVGENYALLASQVMWYQDHFNRFPDTDELMGIDPNRTIQHIYGLIKSDPKRYKTDNNKPNDSDFIITTEKEFANLYGELTPKDVQQQLNRTYPNVITKINKYGSTLQVQSVPAPSRFVNIESVVKSENDIAPNIVNSDIWNRVFNELEDKFGFHLIGYSNESNLEELGIDDPMALQNKGFIRRNAIYVNTTNATVDTPIHELIHLLLAEIKFSRPMEYYELVNNFRKDEQLTPLQREEIFADYVSKRLQNIKTSHAESTWNSIERSIIRTLDYILNGQISVGNYDIWKNITDTNAQLSIKDLARSVGSALLSLADDNIMTKVEIHSIMLSTKESLIKNKQLTQECK